jgi:hypothetical protein
MSKINDPQKNEQSKKDPIKVLIENNVCSTCKAMGFPTCNGHGASAGVGGESGGSDKSETKSQNSSIKPNQLTSTSDQVTRTSNKLSDHAMSVKSDLSHDTVVEYDAGLFSIKSDRIRGEFTLKMKPGLSKAELEIAREFLKLIKAEFEEFKNQLAEKGVSVTNFSADIKEDGLKIRIPVPTIYDAFIKHLETKNLLPLPMTKMQMKEDEKQLSTRSALYEKMLRGPTPDKK